MATLDVDLVAPDRSIWSGKAKHITAPAADGEIGIRPGHTPVLATLRPGKVKIIPVAGGSVEAEVLGGVLYVEDNVVTIVIDATKQELAN